MLDSGFGLQMTAKTRVLENVDLVSMIIEKVINTAANNSSKHAWENQWKCHIGTRSVSRAWKSLCDRKFLLWIGQSLCLSTIVTWLRVLAKTPDLPFSRIDPRSGDTKPSCASRYMMNIMHICAPKFKYLSLGALEIILLAEHMYKHNDFDPPRQGHKLFLSGYRPSQALHK